MRLTHWFGGRVDRSAGEGDLRPRQEEKRQDDETPLGNRGDSHELGLTRDIGAIPSARPDAARAITIALGDGVVTLADPGVTTCPADRHVVAGAGCLVTRVHRAIIPVVAIRRRRYHAIAALAGFKPVAKQSIVFAHMN